MSEQEPSDAEVEEYVREVFAGREGQVFVPYIVYDEGLDAIRVLVEDTSITELAVTPVFTLCERTHRDQDGLFHVGFVLEGARVFCKEHALPYSGRVPIRPILDRVVEIEPGSMSPILDIALPMLEEHGMRYVDFPS